MRDTCHDCGVREGQLHKEGCDDEVCPICYDQLLCCGHADEIWGGESQEKRIPYIQLRNICVYCGEFEPDFFKVSDEDWKKYVIPTLHEEVLCLKCYKIMQRLFPNGWEMIK